MKNILILSLLLSGIFISAQTFNFARQSDSEISYNMVGIHAKSYYVERAEIIPGCCQDVISLVATGADGKRIFRTELMRLPYVENARVEIGSGKQLFVFAGSSYAGCDISTIDYRVYRVDTLGNKTLVLSLKKVIDQLLPWSGGDFFILAGNQLTRYNANGVPTATITPGIGSVATVGRLSTGQILLNYVGNGVRFRIMDSIGNSLSDVQGASILRGLWEAPDSSIYGMAGNFIQKFSPALQLVANTATSLPGNISIASYVSRNDTVFAVGYDSMSRPLYMILDNKLTLKHLAASNIERARATGVYAGSDNRVHIVTSGSSGNSPTHSFTGFFQIPLAGNLLAKHDVGVKSIKILKSYSMLNGSMRLGVVDAEVTVQNFGMDTVRYFQLNSYLKTSGISYCLIGLNKKVNALIPPGGSVAVQTGEFRVGWGSTYALDSTQIIKQIFCMNTSVPDSSNDINVDNDFLCQNITILPMSVKETTLAETDVYVFPNPSSSGFYIESTHQISSLEVSDLSGRRMTLLTVQAGDFYLDTRELKAGLYLLRINTGGRFLIRKIVVE